MASSPAGQRDPPPPPPRSSPVHLTSHEINILIHCYLQESNLQHSAFTFAQEAKLGQTTPADLVHAKVARGELLRWLHKGLCWAEVETHVSENGPLPPCNGPFSLLRPHTCVPVLDSPPSPTSERSASPAAAAAALSNVSPSLVVPPPRPELFPISSSSTLPAALAQREKDETSSTGSGASAVGKGKRKASGLPAGSPSGAPEPSTAADGVASGSSKDGKNGKRARLDAAAAAADADAAAAKKDKDKNLLPLPSFSRKSGKPPTPSGSNRSSPSLPTASLPPLPPPSSSKAKTAAGASTSASPEARSKPLPPPPAASSSSTTTTAKAKKKKAAPSSSSATPPYSAVRVSSATPRSVGLDYSNRTSSIAAVRPEDIVDLAGEHTGEVFVCAWNPDGKGKVATGAGDATVRLWEFKPPSGGPAGGAGGKWELESDPLVCKHLPVTDRKDITSIVFTPTGTLLASASYDGIARLWTPQGELHGVLTRHSGPIFSLKFNPKGSLLATAGSDGSVCVWDAVSARLVKAWEFHSDCVLDVDWMDDETLASGGKDKTIQICRVGTHTPVRTFRGHDDEINRVSFAPPVPGAAPGVSRLLASCSDDMTVRIWSLDDEGSGTNGGGVNGVDGTGGSSHGGASGGQKDDDNAIVRAEGRDRFCKGILKGHSKEIYTMTWNTGADGKSVLATGSYDETIRLWDVGSLACLRVLKAHTETVFSLSFSPSGRYLASAGWDGLLVVWNPETGEPIRQHDVHTGIFEIDWNDGAIGVCRSDKVFSIVSVQDLP